MLIYLLRRESNEQSEVLEAQFKNQVFASNPDLYKTLFLDKKEDEIEIEEYLPQNEEDVAKMMTELRQAF